jgi:hypothetical protein
MREFVVSWLSSSQKHPYPPPSYRVIGKLDKKKIARANQASVLISNRPKDSQHA